MNDNLPEINFQEKKEKKGGAFGWLRGRLGMGSRGAMGQAGVNPAAMNAGRAALGASKFGASSAGGLAGLLAGKASTIAAIALVAVTSGVYLANNAPAPSASTKGFSTNVKPDNYVPAILRSQAANQGSSLDMFKDTNKGSMSMETDPSKDAKKPEEPKASGEPEAQADPNAQPQAQDNMAQDMMSKLQGGNMASLTSQLGGGSNKFSGMGGFGNKFGQGAMGPKTGFSSGMGAGFSAMPKFDSRKNKMLAMKGSARPVFGGAKAGSNGKAGPGAFNQAKGLRNTQKSYTGTNADAARSTQDKAWEGTTADGDASGGAGISEGGAGVVTSPSLDNAGAGGGGGGTGVPDTGGVPDASGAEDVSPWANLVSQAMQYILLSAILSLVGGWLCKIGKQLMQSGTPWTAAIGAIIYAIGLIVCVAALALGVMALMNGIQVMSSHGQGLLGTVYVIGGGVAITAAVMAMTGTAELGGVSATWMAAIAGVIGLMGSMFNGK